LAAASLGRTVYIVILVDLGWPWAQVCSGSGVIAFWCNVDDQLVMLQESCCSIFIGAGDLPCCNADTCSLLNGFLRGCRYVTEASLQGSTKASE
jgi:hypothetical protein